MAAVSQGRSSALGARGRLIEFANHFRQPAAPGIEIIETARYRLTLQSDYPIPGPNNAAWIRCTSEEALAVIDEVRALLAPRRLPFMWILDPETEPPEFADHLATRGAVAEPNAPEVAVMVMPTDAQLESPQIDGLEIRDALGDAEAFRQADAVNAEAFGEQRRDGTPEQLAALERRRQGQLAAGNRRVLLAKVDGEPAGSSGLTLYPPASAIITGGAVSTKFRGRGVYRAMVAARLAMARDAGVPGIQVWAGAMSKPILAGLGFETVGWRRFYPDSVLSRPAFDPGSIERDTAPGPLSEFGGSPV